VTPEEIPQELVDLLDRAAGRAHSRAGSVVRTLAEILTRYDGVRAAGGLGESVKDYRLAP
jgi:hypothetical protein